MGHIVSKPIIAVVLVIAGAAVLIMPGAPPPESCLPQSLSPVVVRGTATSCPQMRHVTSPVDVAYGNGDCLPALSANDFFIIVVRLGARLCRAARMCPLFLSSIHVC